MYRTGDIIELSRDARIALRELKREDYPKACLKSTNNVKDTVGPEPFSLFYKKAYSSKINQQALGVSQDTLDELKKAQLIKENDGVWHVA